MLSNKIKVLLFLFLDFIWLVFVYLELEFLGFPDGYLSDLDKARASYYPFMLTLGIAFFIYGLFLNRKLKQSNCSKLINFCCVAYGLFVASFYGVDYLLSRLLDHGAGG